MRPFLYNLFKILIKTGLFFHCKKIKIVGEKNIPKNGAIVFLANHPNGLIDPILIASSIQRKTHFLVKADIFKNPKITKIFGWLGMMPVYRIRDGINSLRKNSQIFERCRNLLKENKSLLIFPEGTHNKKRTIRPISKGFTRIIFKTIDESPDTTVTIISVGITYQNSSKYPSKIALHFGKPIIANSLYNKEDINSSARILKNTVSEQLKQLSVHISANEYDEKIKQLKKSNIDYTKVNTVNEMIKLNVYPTKEKKEKSNFSILKSIIIINSFLPYLLWKKIDKKNTEVEFTDTFRLVINSITFPLFYIIVALILNMFLGWLIALLYVISSIALIILYTKTYKY